MVGILMTESVKSQVFEFTEILNRKIYYYLLIQLINTFARQRKIKEKLHHELSLPDTFGSSQFESELPTNIVYAIINIYHGL